MTRMTRRQALARLGLMSAAAGVLPARQLLGAAPASSGAAPLASGAALAGVDADVGVDISTFPWPEVGRQLRQRFPDLHRHFIFEYYPWYDNLPWRHWTQWGRTPPVDIAATSYPRLGAYSSSDTKVIERHAQWIAGSGVGSVNLSWWGRNSFSGKLAHKVMDVMAAHDIKVTFHLEPYANNRVNSYANDIVYLIREFGDRRKWDCFLILRDAAGREGPVLKGFRTTVRPRFIDCNGREVIVSDYATNGEWNRQTDLARNRLRNAFDHLTLLTSSTNTKRVAESGFDGFALYSNVRDPESWRETAQSASERDLVFSFNCNPGFDSIEQRNVAPDSCYEPPPFVPITNPVVWARARERERARGLSEERIVHTMAASLVLQMTERLTNERRGFFLIYVNSFNEWHEGHAFEPAADYRRLTPEQRAIGYHNPRKGNYRLTLLRRIMRRMLSA